MRQDAVQFPGRAANHESSASVVQDEVAHDAVQLLDRAMMAPDKPAADCMSAAAPASLYLAVCQDNQHSRDALPLLSGISNLTGLFASPSLPALPFLSGISTLTGLPASPPPPPVSALPHLPRKHLL